MEKIFEKINNLTLHKSKLCNSGQFCRAFLEMDPAITEELLPKISSLLSCNTFQSKIIKLYTREHERRKLTLMNELEKKSGDPSTIKFYEPQINQENKKLEIKTFSALIESIKTEQEEHQFVLDYLKKSYQHINNLKNDDYITLNYTNYCLGLILYNDYLMNKGRVDLLSMKYSFHVNEEYTKIDINLNTSDQQFLKYKILTFNENFRISNDKDSQTIIDNRIGKYFWIEVPRKLLSSIEALLDDNMISEISFRIDYISECIPSMEEMEFGSPLRLNISALPEISKFYSKEDYENSLWIHHDKEKRSLTFEELRQDFEISDNNIITQVIHLEYFSDNFEFFIKHLDHEYIIYNIEEYQTRLENSKAKGHKKVKTFKIDNSKIPFNFKIGNEPFLLQVLDAYLTNKNLITEYFEKVQQAPSDSTTSASTKVDNCAALSTNANSG